MAVDVVVRRVRARVSRSEQCRDRLTGAARLVVDEPHQRVVAVGSLPGGCGVLLVRVRDHQYPVEVHGDRPVRIRRPLAGQLPDAGACFGPGSTDRRQSLLLGGGEGVDEAGDRRVGGHRPEHSRLRPQHAGIREAVTAQGDRQGHVQEDLARIVDGPGLPPQHQRHCYRGVQAGLAYGLDQQHASGLRDQRPTRSRCGHAATTRYASPPGVPLSVQPTAPWKSPIGAVQERSLLM
ncbi:plasmid stabilization system protein ParE [Streptomyces canus]